jgi:hypothetical protein
MISMIQYRTNVRVLEWVWVVVLGIAMGRSRLTHRMVATRTNTLWLHSTKRVAADLASPHAWGWRAEMSGNDPERESAHQAIPASLK